jgi:acetyl-CoA acyltransferase 1
MHQLQLLQQPLPLETAFMKLHQTTSTHWLASVQARRGGLANTPADDLLATLFKATFAKTGVPAEDVGDVVIGSVLGPSSQRANECRIAMFLAGMPETVPVHTVNRCCTT